MIRDPYATAVRASNIRELAQKLLHTIGVEVPDDEEANATIAGALCFIAREVFETGAVPSCHPDALAELLKDTFTVSPERWAKYADTGIVDLKPD